MTQPIAAGDIVAALAVKHSGDVFVAECNLGSSWNACRRMDAWAMPKSWSPLTFVGYEVKVSRSDFLRDEKWTDYLPVCHQLYFACPAKLIAAEELPADVGLMWLTGSRFVTKRKAVRRTPSPDALVQIMAYVLMSRSRIVADMHQAVNRESRAERWRRWLDEGAKEQELGQLIGGKIGQRLREAQNSRRAAEEDVKRFAAIEDALSRMGLPRTAGAWQVERKLGESTHDAAQIRRLAESIVRLAGADA